MTALETVLRQICSDLAETRHAFALIGGLAVSARTEPRFTRDADIAVAVASDAEAEAVVRTLRSTGYEIEGVVEQDAVGRLATARLRRSAEPTSPVIDLLFASSGIEPEIVRIFKGVRREAALMRPAGVFVVATLATVIGCGGESKLAGDSSGAASLPTTVNCEDAAQLRVRAARDRRSSTERSSDQERIDLASRARFVATLATVADLRCKAPFADAGEVLQRALNTARDAEDTASFYPRILKWQEAGLIADEAVGLMIKGLPNPAAK